MSAHVQYVGVMLSVRAFSICHCCALVRRMTASHQVTDTTNEIKSKRFLIRHCRRFI